MRSRLEALGVDGVQARTFHSAALAQLRAFGNGSPGDVLPSKAVLLRQIGNGLPEPSASGRQATSRPRSSGPRTAASPLTYRRGLDDHEPPIPADLMERVFREYERRKEASGKLDFEDLLERAIRLLDEDATAREGFRARFSAFTVDEYQDVNLLQQSLLDRWLGKRDDLCAVGDDYQSIYAFVGATPRHLVGMPSRFRQATVVRLETNYRSTPEVLGFANRLVPVLGGVEKRLEAVKPGGPEPVARSVEGSAETAFVVERIRELEAAGVPFHEIAVLYRTNARSDGFEEALSAAGIPFEVRGAAFLARQAARRLLASRARFGVDPDRGDRARARRRSRMDRRIDGAPRRAGDRAPGRPSQAGRPRSRARRWHADTRALRRGARAAVRARTGRPRRQPAHVPRRERPRVRSGLPSSARGEGASRPSGEATGGAGRRKAPSLCRDHAGQALPLPHLVGGRQAVSVPRGARRQCASTRTTLTDRACRTRAARVSRAPRVAA